MSSDKKEKRSGNIFRNGSFNKLTNLIRKGKKEDTKDQKATKSHSAEIISSHNDSSTNNRLSRAKSVNITEVSLDDKTIPEVVVVPPSPSNRPAGERKNRATTLFEKAIKLVPLGSTLQKHRQHEESKPHKTNSIMIPGEVTIDVEDVLGIRSEHRQKKVIEETLTQRKIERQNLVSSRKLNEDRATRARALSQTETPIFARPLPESKSTWKWDDEERSLQSGELTVDIARTHIQPMLEKLYEKKMPSEWLSKLDKPDAMKAYDHILQCLIYPVDGGKSKRESLAFYYKDDFKILKNAFGISEEEHKNLYQRSSELAPFVISMLEQQLERIDKNPIYGKEAYQDYDSHLAWKEEQSTTIKGLISNLRKEPSFIGNLSVIVLEAKDLAAKDNGSSDPYCILHISRQEKKGFSFSQRAKKQSVKTKVIKECLDPVWCEEFSFVLGEDWEKQNFKLVVWDLDSISDHYMGELVIPITSLNDQTKHTNWFPLIKSKSHEKHDVSGELHLVLQFTYRKKANEGPPPTKLTIATAPELHRYYRELIFKLLQLENPDLKEQEIQPLSESSHTLLDEFSLRYGIGGVYRDLVHLEVIVEFFRYQLRRSFIEEIMRLYFNIEASKSNNVTMSIKEMELYENIVKDFEKLITNIVKRYKDVFKDKTIDGTLQLIIKLLQSIKMNKGQDLDSQLETFIIDGNNMFYDDLPHPEMHLATEDKEPLNLDDPKDKLIAISDEVMMSIEEDAQLYQSEFPDHIDVPKIATKVLRDRLCDDVVKLLSTETYVTKGTFDLYFKLVEFNNFIEEKDDSIPLIPLGHIFDNLIKYWINQTHDKLINWCQRALIVETWNVLDASDDQSLLHSGSVVDVFHSLNEAVKFLLTIKENQKENIEYFIQKVLTPVIIYYVDELTKASIQKLSTTESSINFEQLVEFSIENKKKRPSIQLKLSITQDFCVRLNNIETAQSLLMEFSSVIEKKLDDNDVEPLFDISFKHVKNSLSKMIDILSDKMNQDMMKSLTPLMEKKLNTPNSTPNSSTRSSMDKVGLDPLFAYLNIQLELLSNFLYHNVFQRVIKQSFILLIKDLENVVVPFDLKDKQNNRRETARLIELSLKDLTDFFHADGEGIPSTFIDKNISLLLRIFKLYEYESTVLVKLYFQLENGTARDVEGLTSYHIISILACRRKYDREAKDFIKKIKKSVTDKSLKKNFNLDPKEELVDKFSSANEGTIYITTSYLCFDPIRGNDHIKLPITKMTTINKCGMKSVEVTMQDLEIHKFSGVMERSTMINVLKSRAVALGNAQLSEGIAKIDPEENLEKSEKKHRRTSSRGSIGSASPSSDRELEKFRKKYKQSDNATILSVYECAYKYLGLPKGGKMKITQNYMCFNSKVTPKLIIAFNTMLNFRLEDECIKFSVKFDEKEKEKKFVFSKFDNVNSAFLFLFQLWRDNCGNTIKS